MTTQEIEQILRERANIYYAQICHKEGVICNGCDNCNGLSGITGEELVSIPQAAAAISEAMSKWIPVSERLPEAKPDSDYSNRVLITEGSIICISSYNYLEKRFLLISKATHWMELPSLPQP